MSCRVLVADPPWRFGDKLPGPGRGAEKHYPTMSVDEVCAFPLPPLERDAHLFLWRVASMVDEAMRVVRAWGFVAKSELVWLKRTATGKRWFGMGRQVRMEHEVCVIATRGRPPVLSKSVRSTFEAQAGRHSAKPDEFFEIVHKLTGDASGGSHVELFARQPRDFWVTYGNELAQAHPEAA